MAAIQTSDTDIPLLAVGIKANIPVSLRGPKFRNVRWRWRLRVMYPDGLCSYCLGRLRMTIDHVDPVSRGGPDALHNMVPACEGCNSLKGDMPLLMFLWRRAGWCN